MLEPLSWLATIVSGFAVVLSLIYAAIQIRLNTRAVAAAAYAQVNASFAEYAFQIAQSAELADITIRAARDATAVTECERLRYVLSTLSFLRRAENVLFQSHNQVLRDAHWIGIRNSIADSLAPPGARVVWREIRHRINPDFADWIDALLAGGGEAHPFVTIKTPRRSDP
ncbi:MAG: hypothetical protein JWN66_1209 [Sphingomonas bacterium]|uniref:hypothetical protein n=1 Tax=Sphingomonas bacterium TaxID=1895847 RepID=UPI0026338D45|nr:hypothetical protein [Sphingomonas bacterium]MDB5704093.1 hypothetical protein [Sphingomonas bacterium]